jgi:hypothetical protein
MPELMKSSPFQSSCARLNPYGLQHHCEKQIPFCIHDKSILLLGRLDALSVYLSFSLCAEDAIALLYELINDLHSFCSTIFYLSFLKKMLLLPSWYTCVNKELLVCEMNVILGYLFYSC